MVQVCTKPTCIPYVRQCPSCNRVGGADGVLTPTATSSSTQFHAPKQRREGRESVSHNVPWSCVQLRVPRIRAGRAYRETLLQPLQGCKLVSGCRSILRLATRDPVGTGSHTNLVWSATPASGLSPVQVSMGGDRACRSARHEGRFTVYRLQ